MENRFAEIMSKNSDKELFEVVESRTKYENEAFVAAVNELEKRGLATEEMLSQRDEVKQKLIEEQKAVDLKVVQKKVERKKALKEALELLKPTKDYFYTPVIVYLNVAIWLLMVLSGVHPFMPSAESLLDWGGNLRSITLNGEFWRLLTNVFLHGGLLHLFLNMYALLYIGGLLEKSFGKNRYLLVYLVTGVFASLSSIAYNTNIVSIGASGAIFGIYGLFLSLLISKSLTIPGESRQNLLSSIVLFIGYNLFYGLTKEGIDNAAHIGGLVSGFAIGFAYYPALKKPDYLKPVSTAIVACLLVLVFVSPKIIHNKEGEFRKIIEEFGRNEEQALWMYREDMSKIPEDKVQQYLERFKTEGSDLWERNVSLLNSLNEVPDYLQPRVDILLEYSKLRKESCEAMQVYFKSRDSLDLEKIGDINHLIDSCLDRLKALNN